MDWLLLGILLMICSFTDIKSREISVKILIIFAVIGMLLRLFERNMSLLQITGGIMVGLFVLALFWFTGGEIGIGDGLLLCVTGIYLGGNKNMELLVCAVFLAALYSVFLMIVKKGKKRQEFPFVPFLLISCCCMKIGIIF